MQYNTPQYSGIEVDQPEIIPTEKKTKKGFSFADMAKKTQKQQKKRTQYSFRNMAKSTLKATTPTFNLKFKKNKKKQPSQTTQKD